MRNGKVFYEEQANQCSFHTLPSGDVVGEGIEVTLNTPLEPIGSRVCVYRNPDCVRNGVQGQLGFGFNVADGGAFLPAWDLSEATTISMDFGQALTAMKKGYPVCRKGWNGKDLYVLYNESKALTTTRHGIRYDGQPYMVIYHTPSHLDKATSGTANTWVPSVSDVHATDWQLYSPE